MDAGDPSTPEGRERIVSRLLASRSSEGSEGTRASPYFALDGPIDKENGSDGGKFKDGDSVRAPTREEDYDGANELAAYVAHDVEDQKQQQASPMESSRAAGGSKPSRSPSPDSLADTELLQDDTATEQLLREYEARWLA